MGLGFWDLGFRGLGFRLVGCRLFVSPCRGLGFRGFSRALQLGFLQGCKVWGFWV